MREILFRGKSIDTKAYWIYGYGIYNDGFYSKIMIYDDSFIDDEGINYNFFKYDDVITDTVCQYTCVYDSNNMRVFEGDIIEVKNQKPFKNSIGYVVFENGTFRVKFDGYSRTLEEMNSKDFGSDFFVVGNIYDNPVLLPIPN